MVDLSRALLPHQVDTVIGLEWKGVKNGELLRRTAGFFDVFVTMDVTSNSSSRLRSNLSGSAASVRPATTGPKELTWKVKRNTLYHMRTTLTIRTDDTLRVALEKRARAQGKTLSEVAREILRNALEEHPLKQRTGHLRGRLSLRQEQTEAWRKSLRKRNWRA
ncbi:MAG TPA: hypothetical protein VM737_11250 [Gemmatimonadota bacterium]|nr:hypothetical protein [Gemmatimonadota bacterium]